jgi:hypothetical protein
MGEDGCGATREEGRAMMGIFKKPGVHWIDYFVSGHRQGEWIGPNKHLAKMVLRNSTGAQKGRDVWGFFDDVTPTAA